MFIKRKDYIEILDKMFQANHEKLQPFFGKNFWPVIHIQTGYFFHLLFNKKFENSSPNESQINHSSFTINDLFELLKVCVRVFIAKKKVDKKNVSSDCLLVGFYEHITPSGENIYLDPLVPFLSERGKSFTKLYLRSPSSSVTKPSLEYLYKCLDDLYFLLFKLKYTYNRYFREQNNIAYKNSIIISSWLKDKCVPYETFVEHRIYKSLLQSEVKLRVFKALLTILKPKKVWTYCYYDNTVLSLSKAGKDLGIPVIEYQHSLQDDNHFAYCKWQNIDEYNSFFPSHFWVWRASDKKRIERNFSESIFRPTAILGGNIYLGLKKRAHYIAQKKENNVLICLQGQWIPSFLENFIKDDENFIWHIRLHPRYPEDKVSLLKLKERYPIKIEIEKANSLSLYELFNIVKFNITAFSGTALEAQAWGVKNIIFSEEGYSSFRQQIIRKEFAFVTTEEDLQNALSSESFSFEFDKIETDLNVVSNALQVIYDA
ncbi:hypothetical protein [Desertivirga xinjiangensis]|uniref:hypothetical protein n=1 Tax=Desertivirga xinjiangensis TaxID=539206 RepID=UPI002109FB6B|nr:hypothetical protein [Pedobacter xinjiangensis]